MTSFLTGLAVDAIAVHRLTRLATADEITQNVRDRVIEGAYERSGRMGRDPVTLDGEIIGQALGKPGGWQGLVEDDETPPNLATLVTCRWCASVWIAAGVLLARRVAPRWWGRVARVLALSTLGTLIAGLEE